MNLNEQQRDVWERTSWLWLGLFYVVLVISVILGLRDPGSAGREGVIVTLGTAVGVWHAALFYAWVRWNLRDRPWLTAALVGIGVALWYALVRIDPVFYFMLGGLFPWIYIFLRLPWAIMMSLVLNGLAAYDNFLDSGQIPGWWRSGLLYWVAYSGLAILLGVWIYAIINQSVRRRELIEQLQATQNELAAAERREGMLEERARLAREIHDTLAQGFTSIIMHLEAADQALDSGSAPERLHHHLDKARDTARYSLQQARQVVQDLRPDLLAQRSLPEAIERVVQRWSAETGITAVTTTTGTPFNLHPDVDVTLLRAAQEALANVRKHAQAQEVRVTLSYIADVVVLDVEDDGVGVNENGTTPAPLSSGFGLTAMRERVAQFGGTVELESEAGEGTTLAVAIPVRISDK